MTPSAVQPSSSGSLQLVAHVRRGQPLRAPFGHPHTAAVAPPTPTASEHQAQQALRQLQAMCVLSPDLQRIRDDALLQHLRGHYRRAIVVHHLHRFVVEPAAISLTAQNDAMALPWFRAYPTPERRKLAEQLADQIEADLF